MAGEDKVAVTTGARVISCVDDENGLGLEYMKIVRIHCYLPRKRYGLYSPGTDAQTRSISQKTLG